MTFSGQKEMRIVRGASGSSATTRRSDDVAAFVVRRSRVADAPSLPAIERSAGTLFETVPEYAWVSAASDLPVDRHLQSIADGTSWVATVEDDRIVAFLCAEVAGDALHIWELSVALDLQRQGIGRTLMIEAVRFARQSRLPSITLTTFRHVPWNMPVYLRMGFETLEPGECDHRIREILRSEINGGLPQRQRCAMRLRLSATKPG